MGDTRRQAIILLSDKRSGSTMLERELCRHEAIRHVGQTPHSYNETHHWLEAAVMLGLPAALFSGGQVYQSYGSAANARACLMEGIRGNVPDFEVPENDRELAFKGWEALCRKYAQPVFFEKSPQHLANWGALALMLEWAEQTEFDVKFIGLVRNPMAVMYSAQKLFGTDPVERQFGWVEIQRNLLAFREMVRPEQYLQVRYEDLTSRPVEEFGKICDFIEVGRNESIGKDVHAMSIEKWRADPAFTLQLDPVVRQMAQRFGYAADALENPAIPGAAAAPGPSISTRARNRLRDRWIKPLLLRLKQARKP